MIEKSLEKNWIDIISDRLSKEPAAIDFLYVIKTMILEKRYSVIDLLKNAENGYGLTVHEGLSFSLENDFDNPNEFNGVTFFIGEQESSILEIRQFVYFLGLVVDEFYKKTGNELVGEKLKNIKARYKTY